MPLDLDREDRVVQRDPIEVGVRRFGPDSVEELSDFPLPAAQILAQHLSLRVVGDLACAELLPPPPDQEIAFTGDAQIAHPLRVAAWCDQVAGAVEGQDVHGCPVRPSRLAAAYLEDARSPHADPRAGQAGDEPVEDIPGEP